MSSPIQNVESTAQPPLQATSRTEPMQDARYAPPEGTPLGRGIPKGGLVAVCFACFSAMPPEDLVQCYCLHNYCPDCVVAMVQTALRNDKMYPKTSTGIEGGKRRLTREGRFIATAKGVKQSYHRGLL
ncbi:hypothetical protein ACHAQJ_004083 [Trichoderma viride]